MSNKILIIDEHKELCTQLTTLFATVNLQVMCVHDGEAGIKTALAIKPRAVILDLLLPKKNGYAVLQAITQHLDCPVLVLYAYE